MIFLDVVYNHFGPDGNYLSRYAPEMFRTDVSHALGPAIDFRARRGAALLHRERTLLASSNIGSTGCGSMPYTP